MVKKVGLLVIPLAIIALLVGSAFIGVFPMDTTPANSNTPNTSTANTSVKQNGVTLDVFFLDVAQADCILLKTAGHNMLIDAGNTGQDKLILDYLTKYDVTTLDYLVATHPHADHIGSMTSVVKAMNNINMVLMPDKSHTTKTFENLIKAIDEKDIPVTMPKPGDTFTLGSANIQVLAPCSTTTYKDLNDYSLVLRVEFGDTVFLFTGDAETKSEDEQLLNDYSLKADVIKISHHGSRTSSTQKYLDRVSPKYAVISCGTGNTYGHPHKETMTRLTAMEIPIYRTDIDGTIIFVTDGKQITITVEHESETTLPSINIESVCLLYNENHKIVPIQYSFLYIKNKA